MSHIQDLRLILQLRDARLRKDRTELALSVVCLIAAVLVAI